MTKQDNGAHAPLDEEQLLTWEDLSAPQVRRLFVPKYNKYVEFLNMVPFDVLAEMQARYLSGPGRNFGAYGMAILEYVMVNPALKSPEAKRAALKADGALLMQIIQETVSEKDAKEIEAALAVPNA